MTDVVNHPKHYTSGKVECINAIEAAVTGLQGFEGYCTGNAIKYLWRWKQKGGVQDLQKARWYIDRLQNVLAESAERAAEPAVLIQPDYMDAYDTVEAQQLGSLDRG